MPLSVLIQSRPNLLTSRGGDTTQILKTCEYLRHLGVRADISLDYNADASRYDLVHIFNIFYPHQTYLFARNAKNQKKRVVLSPIYIPPRMMPHGNPLERGIMSWLDSFRPLWPLQSLYRRLARGSRDEAELFLLHHSARWCEKQCMPLVDRALFVAKSEMDAFIRDFQFPEERCLLARNGIEPDFALCSEGCEKRWERFRDWALCAGRIDPNKNQLNLALAARKASVPLVLVGPAPVPGYLKKIRRLESRNLVILPPQARDDLKGLYRAARVHALVSYFDNCGLSNLEAAVHGCQIVASDSGYMRDYLGEHAHWCQPDDVDSISAALTKAMQAPASNDLSRLIRETLTWEKTAQVIHEAYEHILAQSLH